MLDFHNIASILSKNTDLESLLFIIVVIFLLRISKKVSSFWKRVRHLNKIQHSKVSLGWKSVTSIPKYTKVVRLLQATAWNEQ